VAFEGDLKNLPLADVLQTINQNNLTGTLTVKDSRGERRVAFSGGFIVAFNPAPGDARPVLEALTKRRLVGKTEAEKARGGFLGKRKTLRLALAQRGLVTEEDYQKVVKEDVLEGIYELFLETDRTFKFEDGAPDLAQWDADQVAADLRLPAPGIVMEGARRCDEWGRIRRAIGSLHDVLTADGEPDGEDDPVVKEILQLADGTRDLATILELLPVARFKGTEAVAQLVGARRLRPATAQEYVTLGAKAEERGAFDEAASLYDRGLSTERGNLTLRGRRANALERAGRRTDAADERKLLASSLLEQGKRLEAAAELTRAADLAPRDPAPLERRLQIAQEDQDRDVARVVAARLAALYEDLGLGEKARDLLRAMCTRYPEDDELREKLAELLHRQGDAKGSVREWNELAGRAMRREQLALAAARYRKALEVDPGDADARQLLRDIETGEVTARRIRRRTRIRLAITSFVVVLVAAAISREAAGLLAYQKAHLETGYVRVAEGTPESITAAIEGAIAVRDADGWTALPRTLAARQADELALTLIEIYGRAFERASRVSVLQPRPPGVKIAPMTQTESDTQANLDGLEQIVLSGDDALEKGDRNAASELFERALNRIRAEQTVLASASDAARGMNEIRDAVTRFDHALMRTRAGRVRCLPLSTEARARFEDLVGKTLPPLPVPEKK
jgi:tetratricopeptide (TPR) repeat protein